MPVTERITTVSVSITSLRNLTPDSSEPVVTPVAANRQSPLHHVLDAVDQLRIGDAHLVRALALLLAVEDQPALHLAADAAQRRRRQHALGRAAGADIHVDSGIIRVGAMNDARHVAIGDQPHRGAGAADAGDDVGVARTIEHQDRDRGSLDTLGLGQPPNIVGR